jgi:hypothetical protein
MNTAISNGLQATSLGSSVVLSSGYPTEAYYCVNSSGSLVQVSNISSQPSDCSAVGDATRKPGDYVVIRARYTFTPMFQKMTAGSLMPTNMVSTSYMRLK